MRRQRKREEPKQAEPARFSRITRALDLPDGVLDNFSQISLSGNREAMIEGCNGVLEYDSNIVRLSLNRMMVQFTGRDLEIKCMTGESVIVKGFILGLEFLL